MTQINHTEEVPLYSTSSVQYDEPSTTPLVVAKPLEVTQSERERQTRKTSSAVHFRDDQPSIQYNSDSSRLILRSLGSTVEATVLEFGSPINSVGVHDDSSNLVVHVLLETYVLYSMILTPAYLNDPTMEKQKGWISEFFAPSFSIRPPLYMHSVSATSLIFSFQDGGLLRLTNNGQGYNEHIFSDSSYFSSFRSILPWTGRPSNLVISMQACVSKNLLFTLSVDAKLKTWDISTGKLLAVNDTFSSHAPLTFLADPFPSQYLTLHDQASSFTLVTYCPQRPGLFKVYKGRGKGLEELFSFSEQQPPSGIWRMFSIALDSVKHDGSLTIHVLWKSDTLMLIQTAYVNLVTHQVRWNFSLPSTVLEGVPSTSRANIEHFIFESGRFTTSIIKSAMASSLGRYSFSVGGSTELRKRIMEQIYASSTLMVDPETGNSLQEKYDEDIRLKVLNLAQICVELDRLASEAHSIQLSPFSKEVLVSQSSKITFLRPATALENMLHNAQDTNEISAVSEVVQASLLLRDGLSIDLWEHVAETVSTASTSERTMSADDAMFLMYEKTIEHQLPAATLHLLASSNVSKNDLIDGLNKIVGPLSTASLKSTNKSVLGIDAYVAIQYSLGRLVVDTVTVLLGYLMYSACSSDDADIYALSALYIKYLFLHRQAALVVDSTTIRGRETAEHDNTSMTSLDDSTDTLTEEKVVLHMLAQSTHGEIPHREFLEAILVLLLNRSQSSLAVRFSKYVSKSPTAIYLKARSLLLHGDIEQASALFARNAVPFTNSTGSKAEQSLEIKVQRKDLMEYYLHVATLFSSAQQYPEAVRFCVEASIAASSASLETKVAIMQSTFQAAIRAKDWSEAYTSIALTNHSVNEENLRVFVVTLCEAGKLELLHELPFVGLVEEVDAILERKARNMLDVRAQPSYHKILYSFRIQHSDYRGAAAILYHRLQFLINRSRVNGFNVAAHLDITEGYLAIINALRCLDSNEAWIIVGTLDQEAPSQKRTKTHNSEGQSVNVLRKVLKLSDIRAEYDRELRNMEAQLLELQELAA
ncbi:Nucleoporin nup120 [Taphrina deformans PYCC 5710]|uniref:Nucleoporin nup120 n=1 Tax=Taphrina deformans (strain PYCC 5710 / ATCC 11124 / CBS 356.35 / IMI 108563 / JCM 9778 / NBRC 8474) TaxID=1097556 RepID=R4XHY0_TAPDE|nr:Nucleoporin nup120 [Taphrina deformans PYCC 5710]|eukprot:CCG83012.1 Nucleoporin nup120 [Taphrina deformans PYCC 5710]